MRSIIFIIIIFNLNLFSQNDKTRFVRWDKVGQTVTLKKGTDFRILYGKANPESTEIKFSQSSDDNEFTLELVPKQGPPTHMPPMPQPPDISPIIKDLESQIKELQISNDSLVKVLSTTTVKNETDIPISNDVIIEKVSEELTKEYELSDNNDQIQETIQKNEIEIDSVRSRISINLDEFDENKDVQAQAEKATYLTSRFPQAWIPSTSKLQPCKIDMQRGR